MDISSKFLLAALSVVVSFTSLPGFAVDRGTDHPALERYPGAVIKHHDYKEYEEAVLMLGKPYKDGIDYKLDKALPVEGQVTYIHYLLPKSASTLQVFRNYQKSIERAGGEFLYTCERPCFKDNLSKLKAAIKARDLPLYGAKETQYLAAKVGETYISLFVNRDLKKNHAWLFVIEKEALNDELMSPMARSLAENGKIDLYGLLFDTGKASLKESSKSELNELAQVLMTYPELKLLVIGHTDNVGSAAANLALSSDRAQSVYHSLMRSYGIRPSRITASGKGEMEPVADNTSADGRAKNRRVEIIAMNPQVLRAASHSPSRVSAKGKQGEGDDMLKQVDDVLDVSKKLLDLF